MKENATPSKAFLFSKIIAKTIVNINCSVGHKNIVYHVLLNFLPGKVKLGQMCETCTKYLPFENYIISSNQTLCDSSCQRYLEENE